MQPFNKVIREAIQREEVVAVADALLKDSKMLGYWKIINLQKINILQNELYYKNW